jgi:hypothetical protein
LPARNRFLCECNFSIAGRFPCDFLIIAADSCAWHASFIFLGPAKKSPFTADGTDSKCFATLRKRAADAVDCVNAYDISLREAMSAIVRNKTHWCVQNLNLSQGGLAADEILAPEASLEIHTKIVLGRRSMLSPEDQRRRAGQRYIFYHDELLATYDRLLDMAENADEATAQQKTGDATSWYHAPSDQPPPGYVGGDVCGTKKMLSVCLGAKKASDHTIEQQAQSGAIWVRKYHRTSYAVWFRTQRAYARANAIQLGIETSPQKTASK